MKKCFVWVALMTLTMGSVFANVQDPEKKPVEQTVSQPEEQKEEAPAQQEENQQEEAPAEQTEQAEKAE